MERRQLSKMSFIQYFQLYFRTFGADSKEEAFFYYGIFIDKRRFISTLSAKLARVDIGTSFQADIAILRPLRIRDPRFGKLEVT